MASTKRQDYRQGREKLQSTDMDEEDRQRILEFLDAKDPDNLVVSEPEGDTKKPATLYTYCVTLRLTAQRSEIPLHEISAYQLNSFFQSLIDGTHPDVSDDGLSPNSVSSYQSTARKFYRYHDDLDIEPEDIPIADRETSSVDDQDVFTRDELEAMRRAITNSRDRCIFELLVNTGQRITAIQTMRKKDIDLDRGATGAYRHNPNAEGLKGANETGTWRPLLAAQNAVREWLEYHPSDDPDAYLITQRPAWSRDSGESMLNQYTINRILRGIAEDAGVTKPSNAHNFRHTFTTVCKRDYDLDNDTIKHLLGHRADSTVMETTYSHLNDDDFIRRTEVGSGMREEEEESTLTPSVCPTCNEPLPDNAKACPRCGTVFTPDAKAAMDDARDNLSEMMGSAIDDRERNALERMREFVVNEMDPDMVVRMMDEENYPTAMDVIGEVDDDGEDDGRESLRSFMELGDEEP